MTSAVQSYIRYMNNELEYLLGVPRSRIPYLTRLKHDMEMAKQLHMLDLVEELQCKIDSYKGRQKSARVARVAENRLKEGA